MSEDTGAPRAQTEGRSLQRVSVHAGGQVAAIVPQTLDEAWRMAQYFAESGLTPKGIDTPPKVMFVIAGGAEVGFGPFQSLQAFALINGKLTMWGDAVPALLWSNGFKIKEWFEGEDPEFPDHMTAHCMITRPDGEEITRKFSVADAKRSKLWNKRGRDGQDTPWITFPQRMLQMRARGFSAHDGAPDVLKGIAIREEVEDLDVIDARPAPASLTGGMDEGPRRRPRKPKDVPASDDTGEPEEGLHASQEAQDGGNSSETESDDVHDAEFEEIERPIGTAGVQPAESEPDTSETATDASSDEAPQAEDSGQSVQAGGGGQTQASPGELYIWSGNQEPDEDDGRIVTYKNGLLFSRWKAGGKTPKPPIYDLHPAKVEAPGEPSQTTSSASPDAGSESEFGDDAPPADDGSLGAAILIALQKVQDAGSYLAGKQALKTFTSAPAFQTTEKGPARDEAGRKVRNALWDRYVDLAESGKEQTEIPTDLTLMRIYLEFGAQSVPEVDHHWQKFWRSTYKSMGEGDQRAMNDLLVATKARLGGG